MRFQGASDKLEKMKKEIQEDSKGKATTAIEREKRSVMSLRLAKIGYYEKLSFTEAKGRHQCKQIKLSE